MGTLFVRIGADPSVLVEGMAEAAKAVVEESESINHSLKSMTLVVGAALAGIAALAIEEFAKFNSAMTKSIAIMGNLSEATKKQMENVARSLSKDSVKSAEELAGSFYNLAQAGLSAEQAMAALPTVIKFATAGNLDMARSVELLTDAQRALGMGSKDAGVNLQNMTRLSDTLVKASTMAATSVAQLADALGGKAGIALRSLNKDVEEGVAALAALAAQGFKGTEAGQSLTLVLRELQKNALENKGTFDALGVTVFDASGKMRNIADIIADMEKAFAGATNEQKRTALSMMGFQDRTMIALQALIGMSSQIREYESALRSAGGATQEVSEKQLSSFANQWVLLKHQIDDVLDTIGESLAPALLQLNVQLKSCVEWLFSTEESTKSLTTVFLSLVDAIKVFILGAFGVWTILKAIATVLATATVLQVEELKIAVVGLISLFGNWWDAAKGIISGLQLLATTAAQASDVMKALLSGDLVGAHDAFSKMMSGAGDALKTITDAVAKGVSDSIKTVADSAGKAWSMAAGLGEDAVSDLKKDYADLMTFGEKLLPELANAGQTTEKEIKAVAGAVMTVANQVKEVGNAVVAAADAGNKAIKSLDESAKGSELLKLLGAPSNDFKRSTLTAQQLMGSMTPKSGGVDSTAAAEMLKQAGLDTGGGRGANAAMFPDANVGSAAAFQKEIQANQDKLKIIEELNSEELKNNAEFQKKKLKAIEDYNKQIKSLQLAQARVVVQSGEEMFSGLADAVKGFAGEQSAAYKSMFAISKAFAIADATIKIEQGIASAISLPFPANLAAIASVVTAAAGIITTIQSTVLTIQGTRALGGAVGSGRTFLVGEKGPELFIPSSSGTIVPNDHLGGGGGKTSVVINNYTDARPEVNEKQEGENRIIEVVIRRAKNEIASEVRDGRGEVNRALSDSFGLRRGK